MDIYIDTWPIDTGLYILVSMYIPGATALQNWGRA